MATKDVVHDTSIKRIKYIHFGVLSPEEIEALAETELYQKDLYNPVAKIPLPGGVLDRRMGVSGKDAICETCGKRLAECAGHFGHIPLALPVFHAGYFKATIQILQQVCKSCGKVMLEERDRRSYLKRLRGPGLDNPQKMKILKLIMVACKKFTECPYCHATNGVVKKVGVMKIVHEKFRAKSKSEEQAVFSDSFKNAIESIPDIKNHLMKAQDDLNPLRVIQLFKKISAEDCELLGLDPTSGRPELFIWTAVPAPPVCIRPSVAMDRGEAGSNEDDLTVKLAEIITINQFINKSLAEGDSPIKIAEDWEFLQIVCAQYVNSELPGLSAASSQPGKWIRGICQRLKGKQGRFRGNLSGKRVDFSARTVISPDPNLRIDQVAVPMHVAKTLSFPEVVNDSNIEKLRACILNGPDIHPGANYYQPKDGMKRFLKFVADREKLARDIQLGDLVERHVHDDDIVLFNRQPSLHKLSIMAHFAKVRPWRTFRFNECVCTPYNADFDGDEMNLHVPQTQEARAEAIELMGVKNNLVTPRNGQPLIAATQDFITGSYLISKKDTFLNRAQFCQIVASMFDAEEHIDIPPPAIIKPIRLWTGKQVFNMLLRPNKNSPVRVCLETKNRSFARAANRVDDLCPNDGWVVVQDSQIMCGAVDKSIVGDGNKESLFYVVSRENGPVHAAACMNRLAKLCARWLANEGFSIGIEDVMPGDRLSKLRDEVIQEGYDECDKLIELHRKGTLKCQPGCDMDQTLEAQVSGKLSKIRDDLGQICINELDRLNAPLIMSVCGSKGSKINVCQMVACVGQQIIGGNRAADGFDDRTLPHFRKSSRTPDAKGFVRNSFYTGLSPPEFFFHAASGREGLVDTAVKTAETGYMQRRLMKALEDLAIQYDYSVRNSSGSIIQFDYGNDRLDPACMEGEDVPVVFDRTFSSAQILNMPEEGEVALFPYEITDLVDNLLSSNDFRIVSASFKESIKDFISVKVADRLQKLRQRFGLPEASSAKDVSMSVDGEEEKQTAVNKLLFVSEKQLTSFLQTCQSKFHKARIEPGTAVGALGAQSIGEPGTQMTLKTFHFAGVASMNVTLGVPRIKEIINASKLINTPIITGKLAVDNNETVARIVKGRIETTKLGDIAEYIEEIIKPHECHIEIKVDTDAVRALQLEVTMGSICEAIAKDKKLKISRDQIQSAGSDRIRISVRAKEQVQTYFTMQKYKRGLSKVVIKGIPSIIRAVINEKDGNNGKFELLAEGYGLQEMMVTDGIVGTETSSNHIMEVEKVLGIEAARQTIIDQIQYTMGSHGMTIDRRHVMLLADIMTFKGEVLGITRFGIAKMKDSVLMLASFEKTTDHLFDAALYGKKDEVVGVSECIIMGIPMPIGTGLFKVMHDGTTQPSVPVQSGKKPTKKRTRGKKKGAEPNIADGPRRLLFDLPEYHRSIKSV